MMWPLYLVFTKWEPFKERFMQLMTLLQKRYSAFKR